MTAPSSSSTNDNNTACSQVSAASPSVNTASLQVCTASVTDNTVYAFMVENLNGSNVLHQDLEAPRSKEGQFRNQDNIRKQGNNEDTSKAMLAIEGVGFDWSDMAEEQVQTIDLNYLSFKRSFGFHNWYQTNMALMAFSDLEASTYKRGLDTVEAQLVTYRKNEVLFSEEVVVLKREVGCKQYEINMLKTEFEKVKQEKDGIDFKIEKFDKASKDLDQLLGSQITDKSKKGLGYSAVPPPHPLIYNRPNKLDLSYSGLDEFKEPEFKGYGPENSKQESNVVCENESDNSKENSDKSLVKEQVSQDKSSFVEGYGPNTSKSVSEVEPKKVRKNDGAPIIEDWVSDDEEQDESKPKSEKKTVIPTAAKIEFVKLENHEKPVKKSVSGCSRHMTGNIAYLSDFKKFDGGYVAFGGGAYGGKITSKGTLKTANLDFEDVYFVNELKFNLFSVSQMCDKKNYVLFTDTECLVLSLNFKLPDENQILLKVPRKDNMYSFDMKNIVPKESLTCLVAKATLDESMLWHRRLGHINFKNINKLVKDNLDETSEILKRFIKEIENLVDKKVKIIRSDNGTEFKNKVMDDFCREKGKFDAKVMKVFFVDTFE
ncbi:ribonuclease H-like domain-containing protein [Tanacetum coccineum]